MARAAASTAARDSAGAGDSAFRRRWSWRMRLAMVAAGWVIALLLRALYRTLRMRLVDHGDHVARRRRGEAVLVACWHDAIPLAPLLVSRRGWSGTPSVLLSWHRDGEIAAQAIRHLGIRAVRGSETRGRLGGLGGGVLATAALAAALEGASAEAAAMVGADGP